MSQPYSWSLGRNSADLSKTILSEVNLIILNAITPLINLEKEWCCCNGYINITIIADPFIAFLISFTLGLAYIIIYKIVRLKNRI